MRKYLIGGGRGECLESALEHGERFILSAVSMVELVSDGLYLLPDWGCINDDGRCTVDGICNGSAYVVSLADGAGRNGSVDRCNQVDEPYQSKQNDQLRDFEK